MHTHTHIHTRRQFRVVGLRVSVNYIFETHTHQHTQKYHTNTHIHTQIHTHMHTHAHRQFRIVGLRGGVEYIFKLKAINSLVLILKSQLAAQFTIHGNYRVEFSEILTRGRSVPHSRASAEQTFQTSAL